MEVIAVGFLDNPLGSNSRKSEEEKKALDKDRRTEYGTFDNQPAKVNYSDHNREMNIFYGGDVGDGDEDNHSHVKVVNDNVQFWRDGPKDNGDVIINHNDDDPIKY